MSTGPATQLGAAATRAARERRARLLHERERRRARSSLQAFLYRYLPRQFNAPPGEFHRSIYADLEGMVRQDMHRDDPELGQVPYDAAAYAYPRGHGKTTTFALGFVLWVVYNWRSLPHFDEPPFILIVSDTIDQARDRALDVRDEIEGNAMLAEDFGPQVPTKREQKAAGRSKKKWTEKDYTTADGVRVKAVGSNSKVRGLLRSGRRPTLIVCDDLENDELVRTRERRNQLHRWLNKALIPTGIEGKVLTIVIGTILHADSVLSRLLSPDNDDHEFSSVGWLKRRYAALTDKHGNPTAAGRFPLWPEFWPVAKLLRRRSKIGSAAFSQEYLNQAIDDLTSLFPLAILRAAVQRGRGVPFLYQPPRRIPYDVVTSTWDLSSAARRYPDAVQVVVTGWDLALIDDERKAREKDSDWTVGTTGVLLADDRIRVARIYRRRGMSPAELRDRVTSEHAFVGADLIGVENNAAQRLVEIDLRGRGLPIRGHTTGTNKLDAYEGVPALSYLLETARIDFAAMSAAERTRIQQLVQELNGLGLEAHDDMVMSLWIMVCMVRHWQRVRDRERRRRVGPPPPDYVATFPIRGG